MEEARHMPHGPIPRAPRGTPVASFDRHKAIDSHWRTDMLGLAITLLVVALIAAFLGFGGIAGTAAGLAKLAFFVFIVLAVLAFLF